jgi:hypothetical protein
MEAIKKGYPGITFINIFKYAISGECLAAAVSYETLAHIATTSGGTYSSCRRTGRKYGCNNNGEYDD